MPPISKVNYNVENQQSLMVCVLNLSNWLIIGLLFYCLCYLHYVYIMDISSAMIETTIVPIVKNKCDNITDSNNNILIAFATIVSKLFESVLLLKCEHYLTTSTNQFGFKTGHITDLYIYML